MVGNLPRAVRVALLSGIESAIPTRHRLACEIFKLRLTNRLEAELLMLDTFTDRRGLALDVGANKGYYSYHLARLFQRVEAFEPNPSILRDLRASGIPNLRIHSLALSSAEGTMDLLIPIVNGVKYSGWASFDRHNLPGATDFEIIRVPVRPLDAFGFQDVSFIKMDVEGHELAALEGARDTLRRTLPVVLVEAKEKSRREVFAIFDDLGYAPYRLERGALVPAAVSGEAEENVIFKPHQPPASLRRERVARQG